MNRQAGLRIAPGAGFMSLIGDGPGFPMIPGVGLRITMVGGCMWTEVGDGGLVQPMDIRSTVRFGRLRMFRSSDSAPDSDSGLDSDSVGARSAGFPSDHVTVSILGMGPTAGATELLVGALTTAAVMRRCTAAHDSRT